MTKMVKSPTEQLMEDLARALAADNEPAARIAAINLASVLVEDLHKVSVSLERIADAMERSNAR
jgi:hypothetical protein